MRLCAPRRRWHTRTWRSCMTHPLSRPHPVRPQLTCRPFAMPRLARELLTRHTMCYDVKIACHWLESMQHATPGEADLNGLHTSVQAALRSTLRSRSLMRLRCALTCGRRWRATRRPRPPSCLRPGSLHGAGFKEGVGCRVQTPESMSRDGAIFRRSQPPSCPRPGSLCHGRPVALLNPALRRLVTI